MNGKRIVFYILAAFIAGTILLSYLQYNFSKNIDTLISGNQQYLEEYNISIDLRALERDIVHVESNISDYVSTGNPSFVTGINEKFSRVSNALVKVRNNTLDSISGQLVDQLDDVVKLKLSFCKEVLDSLHHKGKYSAETLINTLEGKQLMDSIYVLDQKIQSSRHALVTRLNDSNITSGRKVQISNIILIVLVLLSAALLFWYIISIIQKLFLSEKKLKNAVAVKENFLANMSHEIRTPMNAIIGFTHLLEKENLSTSSRNYVETIKSSGENLLEIINDILDLSKIEAGMMRIEETDFSLIKTAQVLHSLFKEKAFEKNIELHIYTDPALPQMVSGDSARLLQILVNLVGNALKFTQHGYINVHMQKGFETSNEIEVQFSVEDSGIGVPKDKLPFIFDRFQQGDDSINRQFGGTGLGLSIVKELVQIQKGSIEVESALHKGTNFCFRIPYHIARNNAQKPDAPEINDELIKPISSGNILVAEDNLVNQKLIQNLFDAWGLTYQMAKNGKQVLELLETAPFLLVLMDIQMPEMDGYTATKEIRKKWGENIPIIAMTAHAFGSEREKCINAGMNDYISKPIEADKLKDLIIKYTDRTKESKLNNRERISTSAFEYIHLAYLKEISAGNKEFERSIAEDFLSAFSPDIEGILQEWKKQNADQVKKIAHNLKTTISVMGLGPKLSPLLDKLEYEILDETTFHTCFEEIKNMEPKIIMEVKLLIQSLKMTSSGYPFSP